MTPRLPRAQYERQKGEGNRRAMKALVDDGREPGLLGYVDGEPVAWLAIAPRADYAGLLRSRVMKPVDERPAWTIACLFVAKEHRGIGLARAMIAAALVHARERGATLVEACPHEPRGERMPDVFAWSGIAASFFANGFEEVARRSKSRPYVRKELRATSQSSKPASDAPQPSKGVTGSRSSRSGAVKQRSAKSKKRSPRPR